MSFYRTFINKLPTRRQLGWYIPDGIPRHDTPQSTQKTKMVLSKHSFIK